MFKSSALLLSSLALAAPAPSARQAAAASTLPTGTAPVLGHYRLIAATGEILPEPPPGSGAPAAGGCGNPVVNDFINIDDTSVYVFGTGILEDVELVDWGVITTQTASDIVPQFTVGYGTRDLDRSVGGPGARLEIAFYSGYQGFCDAGPTPTPVAAFTFTGLPASKDGLDAGYILTVDLSGGMEFVLPSGPFGISDRFHNADATTFTTTGLLQSFAGEPAGSTTDPDTKGQVTGLDDWKPDLTTGTCTGTFASGIDFNTGISVGSHYLLLRKSNADAAPPATAVVRNDAGSTNPLSLLPGGTPVLSRPFSLIAAATGPAELGVFLVGYTAATDIPTPFGHVLVDPTAPGGEQLGPAGLAGPHLYASGFVAVTGTMPIDVTLCGFDLSVQAVQFGTRIQLTNAVDLTFGLS